MTNMEKIQICQEIVDQIQAESRRPVCRLQFSTEPFAVTDSHLGGIPYLPHDACYPVGEGGQTLWLCAQINFAQMPLLEGFPGEGILQFFLSDFDYDGGFGLCGEDRTVQGNWRIFYYPTVDESVTEEECLARMPDSWEDKAGLWRTPKRPVKMLFFPVEQEGVNYEDFRFSALFAAALTARLPGEDPKEFMPYGLDDNIPEEREALNQICEQMKQGGCKTGGYPRYCQCDPRENPYQGMTEEMLKKYNIPPEAVQRALEWPAWDTLLFQLDDDLFTYPAGDIGEMDIDLNGGILNFIIRSEDLKNRDFSKVMAEWACT